MRLGISFSLINRQLVLSCVASFLAMLFLSIPLALQGDSFPEKGLDMEQVKAQFGSPLKENPAIGKPAIIRWDYGDYSVYFENQFVIHSVPHQRKLGAAKTKENKPEVKTSEVKNTEVMVSEMDRSEAERAELEEIAVHSTELAMPESNDSNSQAPENELIDVEVIEIEETKSESESERSDPGRI